MRLRILIAFLTLASGAASAEWTKVSDANNAADPQAYYVDKATIKRTGSTVKMWTLLNYDTPQDIFKDGSRVQSVMSQGEFDCESDSARYLVQNFYVGRMGSGNVVFVNTRTSTWIPQAPGSMGLSLVHAACGQIRKAVATSAADSAGPTPVYTPAPGVDAPGSHWKYWRLQDPEYNAVIGIATSESVGYRGTLMVRLTPDGGMTVSVGVHGTIVCPEPCKIRAQVDSETKERDARPPGHINNVLYFTRETLPASMATNSHWIDMEINLGDDGWRVFTFNTDGFDWSRMK